MEFGQAVSSASGEERTPPQDRPSGGVRRDPVCARHRMPVAGNSSLFSAGCDSSAIFPSLEPQRGHRPDDGQASRSRRALAGRSATPTAAAIDTQSAETTESGGPSGYDAGKKVKGRKRHLVVDVVGLPLGLAVHAASVQDRDGAPAVILQVLEKAPRIKKIWADGGYQGGKLASALAKLGIGTALEIVKKPKDVKGFTVLQRRRVVERTFAWMSRCQRLGKDYERSLESSLAWAQLVVCRFTMRRISRTATC